MTERRKQSRRPTAIFFRNRQWRNYFEVSDRKLGHPIGHLLDITEDGMRIVSCDPIPVDKTYDYRVDLPRKVAGRNQILLEVRSVWSHKSEDTDCYETGFRIVNLMASEQPILMALVNELMAGAEDYRQKSAQNESGAEATV